MPEKLLGNIIETALISFIVICILVTLFLIIGVLVNSYAIKRILSEKSPSKQKTVRLLELIFGKKNVLTNLYIPMFSKDGVYAYTHVDTAIITKAGIAVCRLRQEAGFISCDNEYEWHQSARLRSGGTLETEFTNPEKQNDDATIAMAKLFTKFKIDEPNTLGLVVFTSKTVVFSCERVGTVKLDEAIKRIKAFGGSARPSKQQRKSYVSVIMSQNVKRSVAESFNSKKLK